jgi:hypothetical protein
MMIEPEFGHVGETAVAGHGSCGGGLGWPKITGAVRPQKRERSE